MTEAKKSSIAALVPFRNVFPLFPSLKYKKKFYLLLSLEIAYEQARRTNTLKLVRTRIPTRMCSGLSRVLTNKEHFFLFFNGVYL